MTDYREFGIPEDERAWWDSRYETPPSEVELTGMALKKMKELLLRGWSVGYWETPLVSSVLVGPTVVFKKGVNPPDLYGRSPLFFNDAVVVGGGATFAHAILDAASKAEKYEVDNA